MSYSDNFHFPYITALADLMQSYNGTIKEIDLILNVLGQAGDGSTVTVSEPSGAPTSSFGISGDLAPSTSYYYVVSFVDPAYGLESAPSASLHVTTPDEVPAPDAPGLTKTTSGGSLNYGTYDYVVSSYVTTNTNESSAVNEAAITLLQADGSDQKITITVPAVSGGITGYNIYRRTPGNTGLYYLTSITGTSFVDDGTTPVDPERFAPTYSSIVSDVAVTLTIGSLPSGYHWKIYRSTDGDFTNKYIGSVTNGDLTFTDTGLDEQPGSPPASTPVLIPSNVGLRSGSGTPSSGDGNDGDWYIDTITHTLYGPKASGAWPGSGYVLDGEQTSLTVSDNLIAPLVAAYGTLPQVATMLPHLQVMDDLFAQVIGLTGATDPDWATQVEEITDLFGFTFAGGGSGPKPLEHRLLGLLAAIAGLNLKVDTRHTAFTDALTALDADADTATDVDGLKTAIATFVSSLTT